jgi:hypothetical protein
VAEESSPASRSPRVSSTSRSNRSCRTPPGPLRGSSTRGQYRYTSYAKSPAFSVCFGVEHPTPGVHVPLGQQVLKVLSSFTPPTRQQSHSSMLGQQVLGLTCWLPSVHVRELGGQAQSQNEAKGSSKLQNPTHWLQEQVVEESQQVDPTGVSSPGLANWSQHC